MRITELLTKDTIAMDLSSNDKNGVIDELVNQLNKAGKLNDVTAFKEAIHNRESQSTTGIGEGIAIPHAKVAAVDTPAIAFGKSKAGVDYQSLDMQPAHLFFMIAAPEGGAQTHLDALAKLSGILMDEDVRKDLLNASSEKEVLNIIDRADDEATEEEEASEAAAASATTSADSNEPYVLAVTACPTGIAHTYMARDALKKQAEKMGVNIKVETNGSGGIKNHLTAEDIERAQGIIVAADVHVETDRFDGKNVIEVPVADGIKRPKELIDMAQDTSRTPFVAKGNSSKSETSNEKQSVGKTIYKHLMNGVSNMLPLVIAGGILMAIVFLFGPNSFDPKSSEHNAFAEQLWNIGKNSAFALIIPVLAGYIARSIADKPGFAAGLVGGMLAVSGDSGFIGGILAGFLAGYLTQGIKKVVSGLPQALEGLKPTLIYPVFSVAITGLLMIYVLNPPASWLNNLLLNGLQSLSGTNIMLLGLVIGAMMAIDMGGPFNKAAYVFATAALTEGNAAPITAAMIGGMVPPIAIATAMLIFKKKFTKEQRGSIVPNYVMGLSFITEGAIPFAAADPIRVIPSMMVGSGVAGAIALGLGSSIQAPHGGIFVIVGTDFGHVLQSLIAIVIGSIVAAILYGILKPKLGKEEIRASEAMNE
ncbi:fructose-specific PTS transporter subunit EIIC [Staphylococcus gallinarum]|jgi:fructose-specific phosphotransferase system IIC component/fructose-specific phosphotransferase system IIA component/fructose-specific phosphotransferase system IIB component|uniref:PTS fructose transporter subunit IIC n=2 Tax=Staphylococcus TaxID=1279 RepID=A0A2T4SWG9_STAGA|nr:PTS fructose transporter subunit IIABC [Staphylococcus gallinarum]MCD8821644.1 fructose-specific PTS transporter subunit EIIC [Staphylococcus gallinarum]PTL06279.1 PTS fructose transporter subunit IIC [Staphylococcus gallinarum]PTL09270.1 PTS fructose transporter subunit IIC [Staphylococcus gallinarum]RIL24940.1 PTS fructose transporter subunit IIC [Staphylococcus gallinarum]RIL25758.1 PTS fructose transporter subunit IIC [Staphylococcus gallinarum]